MMLKDMAVEWRGHLRLAILRSMAAAPGNSLNDSLLTAAARRVGIQATRDQIRTELVWLAEQGLIRTDQLDDGLIVAVLRERGAEAATGLAVVPGVVRPSPR